MWERRLSEDDVDDTIITDKATITTLPEILSSVFKKESPAGADKIEAGASDSPMKPAENSISNWA